ncbi:hypothetical protein QC764_0027170 [Podospora pseudoanserina]|uniref:Uncharacterized protein n=1 Tax=Podospora pseudoanserina TaxID=2609844 RepID=A0ABR0ISU4_9PEZI|nr:hypothetical protein QC764_0027170 [Podospora pseudoanserina]
MPVLTQCRQIKDRNGPLLFFPHRLFFGIPRPFHHVQLQIAQAEEISNRRQRHQPNPRPFSDRSPNIPSTAAPVSRPSRCASHCRSRSRYRYRYLPYGVSVGRNHHTRATSTTHGLAHAAG